MTTAYIEVNRAKKHVAADKALEFIAEVGDMEGKIINKSDQQPRIQYFIKDLAQSPE